LQARTQPLLNQCNFLLSKCSTCGAHRAYETRMHRIIICLTSIFLLAACSDDDRTADNNTLLIDSESCRAAVSEQLSREHSALSMTSDTERVAYEQRYHFCMTQKGYTLPPVKP
jgi:hypothetical protein